jgi:predicted enzyme related to lactoylglutathione lyase
MANQVGWFEVVGQDGEKLRSFYGDVFGWTFNMPDGGEGMDYGLADPNETGIGGGVGTAPGGQGYATFYVGVDDPQASLDRIESLGGKTVVPVTTIPDMVTFALFTDPEGHLVGLYKSSGP